MVLGVWESRSPAQKVRFAVTTVNWDVHFGRRPVLLHRNCRNQEIALFDGVLSVKAMSANDKRGVSSWKRCP